MTFPHTEVIVVYGPEGPRHAVVNFTEKDDKLAMDVLWKGAMPVDYLAYDKLADNQIIKFLASNGVEIDSLTVQDFGTDKKASRKAIKDFLSSSD